MTIRGDSKGTTGGMGWSTDQRFGKWEVRARFPKGDDQYHPVLLLWPQGKWPQGGEVDFAETTSASSGVSFFLHYSSSNKQKSADKPLDLTQWHNYAVEWVDGRITGFIDGQQWFQSTDRSTLPPGQMHVAIQLDYFPDGGSPKPTQDGRRLRPDVSVGAPRHDPSRPALPTGRDGCRSPSSDRNLVPPSRLTIDDFGAYRS